MNIVKDIVRNPIDLKGSPSWTEGVQRLWGGREPLPRFHVFCGPSEISRRIPLSGARDGVTNPTVVFDRWSAMVTQDGNGSLDEAELRVFGEQLGLSWDDNFAKDIMLAVDADGGGTIDVDEFWEW